MEHVTAWDLDRQVVLVQLHHVILALRSDLNFGSKGRYFSSRKVHDHPLLCSAMKLHKRLLSCTQTGCSDWTSADHHLSVHNATHGDPKRVEVAGSGNLHLTQTEAMEHFPVGTTPLAHRLSLPRIQKLTETDILSPFCGVCRCPDIGEPIIIVALSAIDTILDFCRSIVGIKGVKLAIETALSLRSEASDPDTHEVLLARTLQLCGTCIRHQAATELPEDLYIQVVRRALVISLQPEATPLLKRVAEGTMSFLVTCLYSRVIHRQDIGGLNPLAPTPLCQQGYAQGPSTGGEASLSLNPKPLLINDVSSMPTTSTTTLPDGASMMRYISSLISTKVTTLDTEGNIISSEDSPQKTRSSGLAVVADRNSPTIQLEGLSLAQAALLTIQNHLLDSCSAALLSVVQNDLSRVLLVAAMSTTHMVVLALVLRLIHILVESASHGLVPQIFNFLRFIHLNPIITPTTRMKRSNDSQSSNSRANPTNSARGTATLLPLNARVHPSIVTNTVFDDIMYSQSNGVLECREILLESLSELCSNPSFCNFCFLHYDLSWRCHSVLPQLCNVLVESVCPSMLDINDNASSSFLSSNGHVPIPYSANNRQAGGKDDDAEGRGADMLPISRMELVALDTAMNIVSNFALRLSKSRYSTPEPTSDGCNTASVWEATIEHLITQKNLLLKFSALFEESPLKKGIPFLLENSIRVKEGEEGQAAGSHRSWFVLAESAGGYEIGRCLYRLSHLLNKTVLGNYIGELGTESLPKPPEDEVVMLPDGTFTTSVEEWERNRSEDHLCPGTVRFFQQQLEGFVGEFVFENKPLLTSIRELVYHLCLPGESQKIDRVIEVFAKQWYSHNINSEKHINPFSNESGAFVLSFAIIMLNTDLHSGKIQKCMTKSDFKNINRGIDNGNNLPDEYLFAIYNDVKRHELIMAEMADRGFANNVTWDLEINHFSSECERNFALFHISNVNRQSVSRGIAPHSMDASLSPDMAYSLWSEKMLSDLDPYAFNAIQNRCFLIFKHFLGKLCAQVMRLNPRGSTLKDALDEAYAILPQETSALVSSIRGIRMLALSATALGQNEVSDECVMTLSSYVHVSFSEGMDAVDNLHRNLPTLLLIKEIFSLLQSTALSLSKSWLVIGDLLLNLYLLGMLVVQTRPDGTAASRSQRETADAASLCLSETVFRPPDLAALYSIGRPQRHSQEKKSVGWFAALWDSAFNYSENGSRPEADANSRPALGTQLAARVRECVPDMQEILCVVGHLPLSARAQLLKAFMNVSCGSTTSVHSHGMEPNFIAVNSYKISFITACVAATTSYLVEPELFYSHLDYLQDTFSALFTLGASRVLGSQHTNSEEALADQPSNGKKTNVATPWAGSKIMSETIATVLNIFGALYIPKHDVEISAAITQSIFNVFFSVPNQAFNDLVALPLVNFLSSWILSVGTVRDKTIANQDDERANSSAFSSCQSSHASLVIRLLVDIVTRLEVPAFNPAVLPKIGDILLFLVKNAMYDVASDTQLLLKLVLSLEILHKKYQKCRQSLGLISADCPSVHRDEKDLREVQRSPPLLVPSEEAIFADILGYCSGNVVRLRKGLTCQNTSDLAEVGLHKTTGNDKDPLHVNSTWHQLWILSLQSLSCLILSSSRGSRARGRAMLALRDAVLDMEPGTLDAVTIESAYKRVLFPLTEMICAIPSTLPASTAISPELCTSDPSHVLGMQNSSGNREAWMASLQYLVFSPLSIEVRPASAEDKSCIINIISKVFLHHMPILENSPDRLRTLWQLILSTLYDVYTTSLVVQDNALDEHDDVPPSRIKVMETEHLMEETSLLQMAVEETVKNMIYVVASSINNGHTSTFSTQESSFPTFTRHLISPFPFSMPLLYFLDNMEKTVEI